MEHPAHVFGAFGAECAQPLYILQPAAAPKHVFHGLYVLRHEVDELYARDLVAGVEHLPAGFEVVAELELNYVLSLIEFVVVSKFCWFAVDVHPGLAQPVVEHGAIPVAPQEAQILPILICLDFDFNNLLTIIIIAIFNCNWFVVEHGELVNFLKICAVLPEFDVPQRRAAVKDAAEFAVVFRVKGRNVQGA